MMISNKGQIESTPIIMVIIFITALTLLFGLLLLQEFGAAIQDTDAGNTTEIAVILSNGTNALLTIDIMTIVLLAGLVFAAVISGFMVRSHPIFLIPVILIAAFIIFFGVSLSNVWEEVATNAGLLNTSAQLPTSDFLNNNWPVIALVIIVMGVIALFAKSTLGGEQL